jgi:hypothetical protein
VPDRWAILIETCWVQDPTKRPSAQEIVETIEEIQIEEYKEQD